MFRCSTVIALAFCALVLFFSAGKSFAQMAAFRDLTAGSRVPAERLSPPQSCENTESTIDGSSPDKPEPGKPATLKLTIVDVLPAKLEIGSDFTASVRLKNDGPESVLVPSVADGERVLRTSADGMEEKYEVGDVSFRLLAGKERKIPIYLNSGGALFADPEDKSSYLALQPGKWLEIKLHARLECGLQNCLAEIQPDSKAVLTAWWYERILTHRVNGCAESHGSVKVRELDSEPFTVVVKGAPTRKAGPSGTKLSARL